MQYEERKLGRRDATLQAYLLDEHISWNISRKWPCVLVVPGGGYLMTSTREGESVAARFFGAGYSAFVLRYSTKVKNRATREMNEGFAYPEPSVELLEALHLIHENAEAWHIDTERIYLVSFSAGAHIALSALYRGEEDFIRDRLSFPLKKEELNLRGLILGYPMINVHLMNEVIQSALFDKEEWTKEEMEELDMARYVKLMSCPMFVWQTSEDTLVNPPALCRFLGDVLEHHIPVEFHLFERGPHGLALADESYAKPEEPLYPEVESWFAMALRWMKNHN